MKGTLSDERLAVLGAHLSQTMGLNFPPDRRRDLRRGLGRAARDLGFKDVSRFADWLLDTAPRREDIEILAAHLTVAETYFFRDRRLFGFLEQALLPELIAKRRDAGRRLRIWCAGCCTGEEAYSVAVLLHRLLPDLPEWRISLLATDINVHALATAREGVYGPWSFRDELAAAEARFFHDQDKKQRRVDEDLRALTNFSYLNLAEDTYPSLVNNTNAIDVLFCRNVLMYFTPTVARTVFEKLAASLSDDGWLIVAPSELSLVPADLFATVRFDGAILHQRQDATLSSAPQQAAAPVAIAPPAARPVALPRLVSGRPTTSLPRLAVRPVAPSAADSTRTDFEEARRAYAAKQYNEARILAQRTITDDANHAGAMRMLARISANTGALDEALVWCDRSIAAARLEAPGYYLRALVLQEQGQAADARWALRQAVYLDPEFIMAHFNLGSLAWSTGDTGDASRHWRNASRLLDALAGDALVPESDGMTAARLGAVINAIGAQETMP